MSISPALKKSDQQTSISQTIREFFADKPVKKVWLFGSFARGDYDGDSDVDILVAWNYSEMDIGWEYFGWWTDLEALIDRKVGLVSEGYLSKYVAPLVEKDKILIYEKNVTIQSPCKKLRAASFESRV